MGLEGIASDLLVFCSLVPKPGTCCQAVIEHSEGCCSSIDLAQDYKASSWVRHLICLPGG